MMQQHVSRFFAKILPNNRFLPASWILDLPLNPIYLYPAQVDLRGHPRRNFRNFMQFLGKFWQNRRLAPSPTGNPGSTPAAATSVISALFEGFYNGELREKYYEVHTNDQYISGADPGFPVGGGTNPPGGGTNL